MMSEQYIPSHYNGNDDVAHFTAPDGWSKTPIVRIIDPK
ncbi:medium-chain acyl-CoA synthetase [Zymobacter palmae]|uniref:Medium-chain acyl-CoA synthetase n=1 Tax=Zymobacter palmae TaxID=33074 RepID=A0A348HC87_9GAMM|nr:medium-chain acyl-CoA synthetase [Zymobacter palmae]